MKQDEVREIDQQEAIDAVERVPKEEIHCFMGFIGADWDKQGVLDLLKNSHRIAWADNPFEHNLVVINENKKYCFDVQPTSPNLAL